MLRVAQWWAKPAIIFRMFSCVGLDCEIRALFFISQPRCFLGSHRSHRSHGFARLMLNLTDDSLLLCSFWLTQISQIPLNFSFDGVKSHRWFRRGFVLTQIPQISLNFSFDVVKSHGGWQMGRGACRSTLSAPSTQISKVHTNYFCWISLNLCEPKGAKVRRASVRFNARRAKLWDLWDLCEPKGARAREASVRFSVRRARLWDLRDLCEA